MMQKAKRRRVVPVALVLLGSLAIAVPGAAQTGSAQPRPGQQGSAHRDPVVEAIRPYARPLADLRAFGRAVGDAKVVGMGESTHNSREFRTTKTRVFRYLARHKGFSAFSLEASWSTGLRLNEYVLYGKGDPRKIMAEEYQNAYVFWNTREDLALIEWMRAHNRTHRHKVQFMGNDLGYAGNHLFDRVLAYVEEEYPDRLDEITALYRNVRPDPELSVGEWMRERTEHPIAERRAAAQNARRALKLLPRDADPWIRQHARSISQVSNLYAFDLDNDVPSAMLYRDRVMAWNTTWWQRTTGQKVMVSAHNGHVAYESFDPPAYPRVQGALLRDAFGDRYVSVGFTFGRGSFNAIDTETGKMKRFTVGQGDAGSSERTLDQVRGWDYSLDLRTTKGTARQWLREPHATRVIGTGYPVPTYDVSLGKSFDVVLHLKRVEAAHLLPTESG